MSEKPTYEELEQENRALKKIISKNNFKERIFQAIDNSVMILDPDHNILSANLATEKITGLSSNEIIGKKCHEIFHASHTTPELCPMRKMKDSEKLEVEEMIVEVLDKTFLISCSPVFDENSNLIRVIHIGTDITERIATETELKRSEKRYKTLFNNMAQGVFYQNANGELFNYNQKTLDMFGLTEDQFLDRTSLDPRWKVIHEDGTDYPGETLPSMLALKTGKPVFNNTAGVFNPIINDYVWLQINAIPQFKDGEKEPFQVFVTMHDISERKKAADELEKSEARLNAFLNNSPVAMGIWDLQFRYVFVNDTLQRMNGPSLEEHIGRTIEEVLPKAAHIIRPLFEEIVSSGKTFQDLELKGEVPSRPGQVIHALASYFPIYNSEGKIQFIGGSIVDVTKQKLTEDALEKSREQFELAMDASQDGLYDWNLVTNEIYYSPRWKRMLGYEDDELPNDFSVWEKLTEPEDVKRSWVMQNELINKKRDRFEMEFKMKHKDGHWVDILSRANAIFDKNGKAVRIVGTHVDITDYLSAISEKEKAQKQLIHAQKMESIGTMAGGIAHEFNNILSIIIGNNELIMEDLPKWSLSRESCEEIRSAGIRARDVVKHLLTFSRQDDSTKKSIDIASVTTEALKLIRAMIPSNIEVKEGISSDCSPVFGDPTQIHQILINLCNNAVDALPISGGRIDIELCNSDTEKTKVPSTEPKPPSKYVRLLVRDNGSGMAPEILERIFEPYFTTKDVGKGSGIGLAVVHGIVENHGGSIDCDSVKGEGTTFTILLPAHEGPVQEEHEQINAFPGKGESVLYVDDEPSIAKLGRRHLEALGYDAFSTTDPKEALGMIKAKPDRFNLVISDMAMPNMPGDQLIAEILSINPEMPTMICSGYSSRMSETKASEMGIKAFVMKPLNKTELAKKVREVLDNGNQISSNS